MSTSAQISPAWKEEVNRRLAEHRDRKSAFKEAPEPAPPQSQFASRRALEAAARVAARYANAPSYSETLTGDSRTLGAGAAPARAQRETTPGPAPASASVSWRASHPFPEPSSPADLSETGCEDFGELLDWQVAPSRAVEPEAANPATAHADTAKQLEPAELEPAELEPANFERAGPHQLNLDQLNLEPLNLTQLNLEPVATEPVDTEPAEPEFAQLESAAPEFAEAEPVPGSYAEQQPVSVRWDLDLPARQAEPVHAMRGRDPFRNRMEGWWWPTAPEKEDPGSEDWESEDRESAPMEVEPALPIAANLIEFPRELVAARKARQPLEDLPQTVAASTQPSIFEVDPISLSPEPALELLRDRAPASSSFGPASPIDTVDQPVDQFEAYDGTWTAPAWPGEAEAQPAAAATAEALQPQPQTAVAILPAPLSLRMMAFLVDGAFIVGSVLGVSLLAASHSRILPGARATGIILGIVLLLAAALYETLFFTLGQVTPGMAYARIRLVTLEGGEPQRKQRLTRLVAQFASVLPLGLGFVWSLFDGDNLTWHDRLSGTFLSKW